MKKKNIDLKVQEIAQKEKTLKFLVTLFTLNLILHSYKEIPPM